MLPERRERYSVQRAVLFFWFFYAPHLCPLDLGRRPHDLRLLLRGGRRDGGLQRAHVPAAPTALRPHSRRGASSVMWGEVGAGQQQYVRCGLPGQRSVKNCMRLPTGGTSVAHTVLEGREVTEPQKQCHRLLVGDGRRHCSRIPSSKGTRAAPTRERASPTTGATRESRRNKNQPHGAGWVRRQSLRRSRE